MGFFVAISVFIYQTSIFAPGENRGYDYLRSNNPTRETLEHLVAKLENGSTGLAFASGLAAIDAVIKLWNRGNASVKLVTTTQLFKLAESLGGIKNLVSHPANMTHKSIPVEKRRAAGVTDSLVRLSIGLEEAEDLINDLQQALDELLIKQDTFTYEYLIKN